MQTAITTLLLGLALQADPSANSLGMNLARIEPGSFRMGQDGPASDYRLSLHPTKFDDADWDEKPVHTVKITKPFLMSTTEVTNTQYEQFDPAHKAVRLAGKHSRGEDEAVINVSWEDAVKFCDWLSKKEGKPYRLPTEAEWEYACRAGTTTLFNTGDKLPDGYHKWIEPGRKKLYFPDDKFPPEFRNAPGDAPLTVGKTPANAWGLHDMHGNVEEWCQDWYGPYIGREQVDPVGRSNGDFRVTRGGAHSHLTRQLRSANRSGRTSDTRAIDIGFRVVQAEPIATPPEAPVAMERFRKDVLQVVPEVKPTDPTVPVFRGPKAFVKIPEKSVGPLFSRHNHSPAIVECPNGDLLTVWFSTVEEPGPELCVAASRLRHGTSEWEDASVFWDGADINDHFPKLWSDGEKLFFFVRSHNVNQVMTSADNGVSWSRPATLNPPGEFGNLPFRTREGFLVIPHDTSASLVMSRDGGKTWTNPPGKGKPIDCKPGVTGTRASGIHNAMAQLADGSLYGLGRNDDPEVQKNFDGFTPISRTADWGKTWTYEKSPFPAISMGQRAILLRLKEGPLLFASFTDQGRDWKNRKGMTFKTADGSEFQGYGGFVALSDDDGKTWPVRKLLTDGGAERQIAGTDGGMFTLSPTMAERGGYLSAIQTRDGLIQLISSRNHYTFNLAWVKELPK